MAQETINQEQMVFFNKLCFNPAVVVVFDFVGMVHPLYNKIDVTQTL